MNGLRIENLHVGYGEQSVLHDVSLEVAPGEVLAVVGPNGVGKSTLIRAACGTLPPQQGRVLVNGQDLLKMPAARRARWVSVVPQAVNLPPAFSVMDVVLMGRTPYLGWFEREGDRDREIAQAAMRRTETEPLGSRLIGSLSGGEQQRVLVARALAQAAPVMLLDEPTAHLDLRHQDRLLGMLRTLASEHGLAMLMALHDLNLVSRFADKVALLSNGRVWRLGEPVDVLRPDVLEEVYGMRILVMAHPLNGGPLILSGE